MVLNPSIRVLILVSEKITFSFFSNLVLVKYTTPNLFAPPEDGVEPLFVTTLAIQPLFSPVISSPRLALDRTSTVALNEIVSNVGIEPLTDSYTAITLATSGTFNEISSSCTLNP